MLRYNLTYEERYTSVQVLTVELLRWAMGSSEEMGLVFE